METRENLNQVQQILATLQDSVSTDGQQIKISLSQADYEKLENCLWGYAESLPASK